MLPSFIVLSVILLVTATALLFKRNVSSAAFRYLLFYLCTNFTFELIVLMLTTQGKGNVWVYNLEMIFEVTFFLLLYRKEYTEACHKRLMLFAAVGFIVFSLFNLLVWQPIDVFNSNTYTVGSFLLIFTCCFFLYNSILKNETQNPLLSLMFWVSMGVLFCYLGNFLFLSNVNQLFVIDEDMSLRLRVISISVNLLLYVLIAVGFICNRKA